MFKYVENSLLTSVFFGPQGFQLLKSESEQKATQIKFSCEGSWNKDWFIIGIDTELGDPYLIKQSSDKAFVYTAVFDGSTWDLVCVAHTMRSFMECLTLIQDISSQKSEVFVPDEFTVSDRTILNKLEEQLIKTSECEEFWQQFFVCYFDWLEDE